MLYKVTPSLTPQPAVKVKPEGEGAAGQPRKRRKSAVYDHEGHEVLITMMCIKCKSMKPLAMFGLRKMADGAIRNQPWCRTCRSGAGAKKPKGEVVPEAVASAAEAELAHDEAPSAEPLLPDAPHPS